MMTIDLELRLSLEADALKVTVMNTGTQAARLWSRDNSWGWSMFSLRVAAPGSDQWRDLSARLKVWSANLPHTLTIAPGAASDFLLRRADPHWEGADIAALAGMPLQVRARLHVGKTPDAQTHGVFTGELLSPAVLSQPPHSWLA
jgi:hypothetical protein